MAEMQKIHAWIRDPANNFFKGQSKRAALFELYCEKPETCDLLRLENTCLYCSGMSYCKFGRKVKTEGPTRAAQSFSSTLAAWRKRNEGFLDKLESLIAYNRIFKTHGHFYLPYTRMAKSFLVTGATPLESPWVPEAEMTAELLTKICGAVPLTLFGGVNRDYQDKEVPKFIADLNAFYPEIFALLPDDQKARLATVNYVGRKADITTCKPGKFAFSDSTWEWDGEVLRGKSMLFQPVKGEIEITIKPNPGEPVTITSNEQVTAKTRFLD